MFCACVCCGGGQSESGEEAVDDELSEFGREGAEVGGEAGDSDDEVGGGVGVLVCLHESFLVEDVDVDEGAAHFEVGTDEVDDAFDASLGACEGGVEFELEGGSVSEAGLDGGDAGGLSGDGGVSSEAGVGVGAVGDGGVGVAAVGGGADALSVLDGSRPGEPAGDELSSVGHGLCLDGGDEGVGEEVCPAVTEGVTALAVALRV